MPAKKKTTPKPRTKKIQVVKQPPESSVRSAILGLLVLAVFAIGFYSIQTYNKTEIETVTLPGVEHIHATVDISICGKKFNLPQDTGDLENSHTHKEENTLHWHAKAESGTNRNVQSVVETFLIVETFLKDKIPSTCKKDALIKLLLTVNGQIQTDEENYVWKDGDKLELKFE